eukprot:CAMPEP_0194694950 /NCGR_PEP_ID=MMETSP0295-20121207/21615_1 /TAXON_ID=39354 /ORGANISM="Heterosigma akashiwo, Strain CCMP2393" /LENGTH=62 /DNA_ID=CAMNT_0039586487 /DNA_START=225 /DNA_END=413 /DNA_ORIENTATION=+
MEMVRAHQLPILPRKNNSTTAGSNTYNRGNAAYAQTPDNTNNLALPSLLPLNKRVLPANGHE